MISVLVVDDSVVVRRLIVDALSGVADIKVLGTASNGKLAQVKIDQLRPDVVTMDIEMPEMDGITAVRELRKRHPRLPVIMFSTLSVAGASATLDALAAGATDYVTKPANVGSVQASIQAVRDQLVPRIIALGGRGRVSLAALRRPSAATAAPARPATPARPHRGGRVEVLAVGSSTGGPDALSRVLGAMRADLPVPVVVVQHMPPVFTRMFAERLNRTCPMSVEEAGHGVPLRPGTVYIAPGDKHLTLVRRGADVVTKLTGGPPENSCRPAVDVLFRSVAEVYGGATTAAILTGMGQDGKRGCEMLRVAGADVVAQDEATSVVWGMPGAVVGAGLADVVLPIDDIASYLTSRVNAGRTAWPKVVAP